MPVVSVLAVVIMAIIVCVGPMLVLSHKWGVGGVLIWWAVMWCIIKVREWWVTRKLSRRRRELELILGGKPVWFRNGKLEPWSGKANIRIAP